MATFIAIESFFSEDMSLVHPDKLKADGIIVDPRDAGWRSIGYDLGVGEVFAPPENEHLSMINDGKDQYDIPPAGIVVIRSREKLRMPRNVYADAVPKSSLCEKGLLALNTGVVDPGYEGDIVATVLNFSKESIRIRKGESFLRLVFYEAGYEVEKLDQFRDISNRHEISKRYPHFFLNIPSVFGKLFDERIERVIPKAGVIVTFVATILALIALGVGGYQLIVVGGQLANEEHVNRARTAEEYSATALEKVDERARELAELRERVAVLESKVKER